MTLWVALLACGPREDTFEPLVDLEGWTEVDPADDPWAHLDPGCRAAWSLETGLLEFDTNGCGYLTLQQPALVDLRSRAWVVGWIVHDGLWAEEDATSTMGVAVDGAIVWELEKAIPAPSATERVEAELPFAVRAGTPIQIHVHNHGINDYRWLEIEGFTPGWGG